jgi:ribosomal protein S12 methylthiotransferase
MVDSEYLVAQLTGNNFEVLHDSNDESAKTVVVNTCGFIDEAKQESVNTILNLARAKRAGIIDRLFVFGCLAERYKKDLIAEIPEVDDFFGVRGLQDVVKAIGGDYKESLVGERVAVSPAHYAYLKISEGCNRHCSYCIIPKIRGKHVSVPKELLLNQTRKLAERGVKELLVIAQDSTSYGIDLYRRKCLAELLHEISEVAGIERIRLHYAYPAGFPAALLAEMRDNPKICKYLDVPFQHVSDKVLRNMRRGITRKGSYDFIEKIRREIPDIALRTTLMVGHPGEGKAEFEELKQFVREVRFERLGVFPYSEEEGTYSAREFNDSLSNKQKRERADEIMLIQNKISAELNSAKMGKQYRIIIDGEEGDYYTGRTEYDSPEVDGEVLIPRAEGKLLPGEFVDVKIIATEDYDLYGTRA